MRYCATIGIVQLGRAGDILALMPAMKWLSENGVKVIHVVHRRYAEHTRKVDWCEQAIFDGDPVAPFDAAAMIEGRCDEVRVAMVGNNDPMPIPKDLTFAEIQWERTGCPIELFDKLPLVLNRDRQGESELARKHLDGRPLVLFNATHFAPKRRPAPFMAGDALLARIRSRLPDCQVLNLGEVRAMEMRHLMGLYEPAKVLVSTDTGTVHFGLATGKTCPAEGTPTVGLILNDSYRAAVRRPNWIGKFTYADAATDNGMNEIAELVATRI